MSERPEMVSPDKTFWVMRNMKDSKIQICMDPEPKPGFVKAGQIVFENGEILIESEEFEPFGSPDDHGLTNLEQFQIASDLMKVSTKPVLTTPRGAFQDSLNARYKI